MRKVFRRVGMVSLAVAGFASVLFGATGCSEPQNIVDGKAVVEVPAEGNHPASLCYLLEIEREDSAGEELGEGYECVSKAEYDRNNVGDVWVDADGKEKRSGTQSQLCYNCVAPSPTPTGKP